MAEPHKDTSKDSLFDFFDEKERYEHCKEKQEEEVIVERSISEVVSESFMSSSTQSVRDEFNDNEEMERESCKRQENEREVSPEDENEQVSPDKYIKDEDRYADEEYENDSSDEESNKTESSDKDEENKQESSEDKEKERESLEEEENERESPDQHDEIEEGISFKGNNKEIFIFRPVTDGNDLKLAQSKGEKMLYVHRNDKFRDGESNKAETKASDLNLKIPLKEVKENQDCDAATISWRSQGSDWDKDLDSDRKIVPTEKVNFTNRSPNSARYTTETKYSTAKNLNSKKDGNKSEAYCGNNSLSQRLRESVYDKQIASGRLSNNKEIRHLSEDERDSQRSNSRENSAESKLNSKVFNGDALKKNPNIEECVENHYKGNNIAIPYQIDKKDSKFNGKSGKAIGKKKLRKESRSREHSTSLSPNKSGNTRRNNKKGNAQKNGHLCNGENNHSKSRLKGKNASDTSMKSGSISSTLKLPPISAPSNHPYTDSSNEELIHVDFLKVHSRPKTFTSENARNQKRSQERNAKKFGRNQSEVTKTPHSNNSDFPSVTGSVLTDNSRLSLPSINGGQQKQKYCPKTESGTLIRSTSLDSSLRSDPPLYGNHGYGVTNGFGNQIMKIKKPRVPVALKAEALYRDGQLEVSVTDDQFPASENVNVKITLVHKYIQTRNGIARANRVYGHRGHRAHRFLSGPVDRDIIKHRAMYPPMNTYINEEASIRHRQFYYGKIEK